MKALGSRPKAGAAPSKVPHGGLERRAAQRCRLREAVRVRLSGVTSNLGSKWTVHGLMLNATPMGMACRALASDLELLPAEGGMVQTSFQLGAAAQGCGDAFELRATVRSVTQAGTPGYFVVGMEFAFDESDRGEQDRLRNALERLT